MDNLSKYYYLFPNSICSLLSSIPYAVRERITEIRIRKLKPLIVYVEAKPFFFNSFGDLINYCNDSCIIISEREFEYIIENACSNSFHSKINTLKQGYLVLNEGERAGVSSTAVFNEGELHSVKDITSINIRVSKEYKNCSNKILNEIYNDTFPSIIIAGPPSSGKTTLIRDIARKISSGYKGKYLKTTIIDEREEISSGYDVGINTDIIKSFKKSDAIETAVRTLSPDVIVCDEIGNPRELDSIEFGFNSGVSFVVTVHAGNKSDACNRKIIKDLIKTNQFEYLILLEKYTYKFSIYDFSEASLENCRKFNDNNLFYLSGN